MLQQVSMFEIIIGLVAGILGIIFVRLSQCLPQYRRRSTRSCDLSKKIHTLVFFGSGGHTTEMLRMIKRIDPKRYQPVDVVLSHSDTTSEGKIIAAQIPFLEGASWHRIFRSREVKQSWITTLITSIMSLIQAFVLVARSRPALIICNGPGTCVPICFAAFSLRLLGLCDPTIVFAESFCRVETLSLTGKLLYPIADKFLVLWPQLAEKHPRAEYAGVIL